MAGDGSDSGDQQPVRLVDGTFVRVTGATMAFFVAVGIGLPVIPRFIKGDLGGGSVAVGVAVAALSTAAVLSRPFTAWAGNRLGRRFLMLAGAALGTAALAAQALAASVPVVVVLRMVSGVGEAMLFVGAATLINDLSPPQRRGEAASYFSVAIFGGLGIGPLLGEMALRTWGTDAGLLLAAAFALLGGLLACTVPAGADRHALAGTPRPPLVHPAGLLPGLVLALGTMGVAAFGAFAALHADRVGVPVGPLFALYSVVILSVRVLGARLPDRLGLARAGSAALVGLAAGPAIIGLWPTPVGMVVGTTVFAAGQSLLYPALMAMTVNGVPDAERASVVSTFTAFFDIGAATGGVVFGVVAALGGYGAAFVAAGVAGLGGLVVLRLVLLPRRAAAVAVAATA